MFEHLIFKERKKKMFLQNVCSQIIAIYVVSDQTSQQPSILPSPSISDWTLSFFFFVHFWWEEIGDSKTKKLN